MFEVHVHAPEGLRPITPWQQPCGEWAWRYDALPKSFDNISDAWRAAQGVALQSLVGTAVVDSLVRFPMAVFDERGELTSPAPEPSQHSGFLKTGS